MREVDPNVSDEALAVRVGRGDRAAYEALYARWSGPLFGFLLKRTGARLAAEEAHQEAWLRVYRFAGSFDPSRRFRSWIFAIAANCGRDAVRPEPEGFLLPSQPGEPSGLRDLVVRALSALSADDRRVLLLAGEGFDGAEIAAMLGIGHGAVRMRLSRARGRLRELVEGAVPLGGR